MCTVKFLWNTICQVQNHGETHTQTPLQVCYISICQKTIRGSGFFLLSGTSLDQGKAWNAENMYDRLKKKRIQPCSTVDIFRIVAPIFWFLPQQSLSLCCSALGNPINDVVFLSCKCSPHSGRSIRGCSWRNWGSRSRRRESSRQKPSPRRISLSAYVTTVHSV